jgi:predicted ATPase
VFAGANGVGKTNLYRALQLLQASAAGTLARELAAEGGMESASWAGKRRAGEPARIKLQAGFGEPVLEDVVYSYDVEIGVPPPGGPGAFPLEPDMNEDKLLLQHRARAHNLLDRRVR